MGESDHNPTPNAPGVSPKRGTHLATYRMVVVFACLIVMTAGVGVGSLAIGTERLGVADVTAAVFGYPTSPVTHAIVVKIRVPRAVLGVLVGAALGAAGAAYQALFRNPLADPFVVGASSGAAVGAAIAIVSGWGGWVAGFGPTSLGAFAGALLAVLLVYAVAAVGRMPPVTLLLAGSTVSTMLGGVLYLIMTLADKQLHQIFAWLMGGLAGHGWDTVAGAWAPIVIGTTVLSLLGRPLDAVCCGEDVARALGLRVGGVVAIVLLAANLAVAAAVAAGGVIGFVGLVAPHLARPLVGAAHARLIPASGLIGATLLLIADCAARSLVPPLELPIGVLTAVVGGPIFLIVLRSKSASAAEGMG
ncbi:FecCD family ABC transporter permease [Fimbriiglobus ruber]|uniref:Vitamin B12 ABC transporter, permease component BtuC n=1 Tax=Fimbriiglobus ruber TaxID=1908690 RepID=A0A225DNJ0_9BACT|nr:iron ABC transporter permease [Fimbriiglobus ruber]OWK41264.1 Vitamin B12 ABC transporter, permease component BtuC [Fimbriiglobus ruber]